MLQQGFKLSNRFPVLKSFSEYGLPDAFPGRSPINLINGNERVEGENGFIFIVLEILFRGRILSAEGFVQAVDQGDEAVSVPDLPALYGHGRGKIRFYLILV